MPLRTHNYPCGGQKFSQGRRLFVRGGERDRRRERVCQEGGLNVFIAQTPGIPKTVPLVNRAFSRQKEGGFDENGEYDESAF